MSNLMKLIRKNFKLLIRSKASALIVILGPMLIIFLAGVAFDNTNIYRVRVGVFSETPNELSNSFEDSLRESNFNVQKFQQRKGCVDAITQGEVNTCLVLPKNFAIGDDTNNEITFHVDQSKLNLVYMILDSLSTTVSGRSKELSLNFTTVLIRTLDQTHEEAEGKRPVITSLVTQNDDLSKKTKRVKSTIKGWDLGFNVDTELNTVLNKRTLIKKEIENVSEETDEYIDDLKDIIDRLESAIRVSNLSGEERDDVLDLIEDVQDAADDVDFVVEDAYDEIQDSGESLNHSVLVLSNALNLTRSKFDTIGRNRNDSIKNLSQNIVIIDNSLVGISSIQDSINKISKSIDEIEIKDPSTIVQPIKTKIKPVIAPQTYLNYIFPTIIVLVVMFTAILLAPVLIFLEKKSSAVFRNFMTPTKNTTYWLAIFLTSFAILSVQAFIIIGIAGAVFGTLVLSQIANTLLVLALLISLFTFVGMIIGYVFHSEETAILASISLGTVSLFLSNTILPIESISGKLSGLIEFNPMIVGGELLRKMMVFSYSIPQAGIDLLVLAGYTLLLGIISFIAFYITKKHYIAKTLKKFTIVTPKKKR